MLRASALRLTLYLDSRRKPQQRKNKTWEGDAYVSLIGTNLCLISEKGKLLGRTSWSSLALFSGLLTRIGGKEVQLDNPVPEVQVPNVVGTSEDAKIDIDAPAMLSSDPVIVKRNELALQDTATETPVSETRSETRFITPTSFYAAAPPKAKSKQSL